MGAREGGVSQRNQGNRQLEWRTGSGGFRGWERVWNQRITALSTTVKSVGPTFPVALACKQYDLHEGLCFAEQRTSMKCLLLPQALSTHRQRHSELSFFCSHQEILHTFTNTSLVSRFLGRKAHKDTLSLCAAFLFSLKSGLETTRPLPHPWWLPRAPRCGPTCPPALC